VWLFQLMAMEGDRSQMITDAIVARLVPNAEFNLRPLCSRYSTRAESGRIRTSIYGIQVKRGPGAGRIELHTVGASLRFPHAGARGLDFGTSTNFELCVGRGGQLCGLDRPRHQISASSAA